MTETEARADPAQVPEENNRIYIEDEHPCSGLIEEE